MVLQLKFLPDQSINHQLRSLTPGCRYQSAETSTSMHSDAVLANRAQRLGKCASDAHKKGQRSLHQRTAAFISKQVIKGKHRNKSLWNKS